jgi:formate hydrogenlyase subunit 3/multisubunit Na+/H+ antiporter MnhD subunit
VIVTPDGALGASLLPAFWVAALALFVLAAAVACVPRVSALSPTLSTAGSVCALALGCGLLLSGVSLTASGSHVLGLATISVRYDGLSAVFLAAFGLSAAAASLSVVGERPRSRPLSVRSLAAGLRPRRSRSSWAASCWSWAPAPPSRSCWRGNR